MRRPLRPVRISASRRIRSSTHHSELWSSAASSFACAKAYTHSPFRRRISAWCSVQVGACEIGCDVRRSRQLRRRPRRSSMQTARNVIPATLIPGDGIGPEIIDATVTVLDAAGAPFEWDVQQAGMAGMKAHGDPLPQPTLESIRRTRLALKGPLATPSGGGYRSSNVRLREEFHLYANVRPARTLIPGRYENIDLVLVRENTEGLYVGYEHYIPIGDDPHAVAIGSGVNTRAGCIRIAEFAFDYAVRNKRRKVTIVHKANIMKALTGIFL